LTIGQQIIDRFNRAELMLLRQMAVEIDRALDEQCERLAGIAWHAAAAHDHLTALGIANAVARAVREDGKT
jgi:hypothetical protein